MTFEERMAEVVRLAEETNRITYLYFNNDAWFSSHRYLDNAKWLFKAYPGGRKILSIEGKKSCNLWSQLTKVCSLTGLRAGAKWTMARWVRLLQEDGHIHGGTVKWGI